MNITLKTEYALRALQEIINTGNGKPINRKTIAKKQKISENFLEKICLDLKKSNIVKSVMGPGGGFLISGNLKDISLWDIYVSVESDNNWLSNCYPGKKNDCEISENCNVKEIWFAFNEKVRNLMKSLTLKDLITNE